MGSISYTIPTAGVTAFNTAAPEVDTALQTLLTWANGNIDGANVAATLTGRRLVGQAGCSLVGLGSGNYVMTIGGVPQGAGVPSAAPFAWWYLDPANYAVVGKSNTQLLLRMSLATNGSASGVNFTGELAAITAGGTAGVIGATLGTVQASAAINAPGINATTVIETSAFACPAAGAYAPVVNVSAAMGGGSAVSISLQLFALNS